MGNWFGAHQERLSQYIKEHKIVTGQLYYGQLHQNEKLLVQNHEQREKGKKRLYNQNHDCFSVSQFTDKMENVTLTWSPDLKSSPW